MSLAEVLPEVESLSRLDKIRLIQVPGSATRTRSGGLDRTRQVLSASIARSGVYCCCRPSASPGGGQRPAMSTPAQQFPYVRRDPSLGQASLAPMLPLTLIGARALRHPVWWTAGLPLTYCHTRWVCNWDSTGTSKLTQSSCPGIWPQPSRAWWFCQQPLGVFLQSAWRLPGPKQTSFSYFGAGQLLSGV